MPVWIQKLTFPLRYPNMVPVITEDEVLKEDFGELYLWRYSSCLISGSSTKVQLQLGMRNSMRERRSRHDRTCFWQSTVVTLLEIVVAPVV